MKKILISGIVSLLCLSCSISVPNNSNQDTSSSSLNFSDLEKEYNSPKGAPVSIVNTYKSFSTKALSDAYVKRMFGKYLGAPVNSVQLIRQLEFSRYLKAQNDTSYETSLKNLFVQTPSLYDQMIGIAAISSKMTNESATFGIYVAGLSPYTVNGRSCLELKNNGVIINGSYHIDSDNNPLTPKIKVYCDMTTDGGGWTLVVAQFEADPVSDWNEGIQADYDPTLATEKGFALKTQELPFDRTQTAFGRDLTPTGIDYVDFVYTTGNIDKALVTGKKSINSYHIDRDLNHHHSWHDPETPSGSDINYNNTLTFDKTGGAGYDWAFSSNNGIPVGRSYSYNGLIYISSESFAWTVWVR